LSQHDVRVDIVKLGAVENGRQAVIYTGRGRKNLWSDTNLEIEVIDLIQQFFIKLDISESRHLRKEYILSK